MSFLRTASSRRLTVTLTGVLAVLMIGAAIALAAAGSGPVPAPKALPQAIHDALAAPSVQGITARISFTDHLVPSTDLGEGSSDPLLNGGTGRVWFSPATHQLRIEVQGENGDAQIVVDNRSFWAYDPQGHTVYEGTLPADRGTAASSHDTVPSVAQITRHLSRAGRHLAISGAQPTDVAGQAAYAVSVAPKAHPGLLGALGVAWDAATGTPLRFTVTARGSSDPVIELTATDVSFGTVDPSVFAISPPAGSHVAKVTLPQRGARHVKRARSTGAHGRVITRGQGLDSVAIIEQPARSSSGSAATPAKGRDRGGVTLPTVEVNGASAQELTTPLGTLIRFTRGSTTYTVIGSQPAATVLAAARTL